MTVAYMYLRNLSSYLEFHSTISLTLPHTVDMTPGHDCQ
jgi:hypothetical protein